MYFLQKIRNYTARLTVCKKCHDLVTPLWKKVHWLPLSECIIFKLATLSFRYFDGRLAFDTADIVSLIKVMDVFLRCDTPAYWAQCVACIVGSLYKVIYIPSSFSYHIYRV